MSKECNSKENTEDNPSCQARPVAIGILERRDQVFLAVVWVPQRLWYPADIDHGEIVAEINKREEVRGQRGKAIRDLEYGLLMSLDV